MLVALVGTMLLGICITSLLTTTLRLAQNAAGRAESLDALHTSALLLTHELRALEPRADLPAIASDSLVLRAFRGAGIVCATSGTDAELRYSGVRDPDPLKDSLLIVTAQSERTTAFSGVAATTSAACVASATEQVLRITGAALPAQSVVLVYESGSYHFDADALRYRPEGGTRQPLTADAFDAVASRFLALPPAGDALVLQLVPGKAPWLPGKPPRARPLRHRIAFLNQRRRQRRGA
jgi:hypothetical protein